MAGHRDYSAESSCNSFPITVAIFACVYNVILGLSCTYLPDDPLYIGLSMQVYAWAGSVLSMLGLIGVVLKRPSLITSFAHFLLIDTFLSAICRLLILQFFLESLQDESLCGDGFEPQWNSQNLRPDTLTIIQWQKAHGGDLGHRKTCRIASNAVQFVLIGLLICITAVQGSLAVSMRRYGHACEQQPRWTSWSKHSPELDPEKA